MSRSVPALPRFKFAALPAPPLHSQLRARTLLARSRRRFKSAQIFELHQRHCRGATGGSRSQGSDSEHTWPRDLTYAVVLLLLTICEGRHACALSGLRPLSTRQDVLPDVTSGNMARKDFSMPESPGRDIAVKKLQRAWKSYWNRKVYRYFRDLIRFRERGDPALLLRSINPTEARYAEAAAGLHVRFRLGGDTFPPMVFYKIYTHRPVTDVCSFCPRDYAALSQRRGKRQPGTRKQSGGEEEDWYLRWENNGWRPVAERLLQPVDPVTVRTAAVRRPFHYSKLKRREDLEQLARRKKLEWFQQMYKSGREASDFGTDDSGPPGDDVSAAEGDSEDCDLLSWTTGLDFDTYQREWVTLATSSRQDSQETDGAV
ncbi:hypothetical protein KFL_000510260 [Klebsormidium nitens]|uniref:Uncharacterized protein n=1 Tax=Klebsormidium nitens TaxID=105231 RepID=A0A1Y1HNU8_KLENI|nr:hypothetical protein KFL_000510260 [Klebsormidium nitens]|eukprot:GAQ80325.1 hypothetical protein KFL_000510260 [Klebsormidium nitens]